MALTTFEFPGLPTLQSQSSSHLRTTTFAGTSLTTDTLLEERFAQSSQAYWVTKCTGCNHYNIPTPEEGVLDMIQPKGFSCCKCGHETANLKLVGGLCRMSAIAEWRLDNASVFRLFLAEQPFGITNAILEEVPWSREQRIGLGPMFDCPEFPTAGSQWRQIARHIPD